MMAISSMWTNVSGYLAIKHSMSNSEQKWRIGASLFNVVCGLQVYPFPS